MNFKQGQFVVYPKHGIGKITGTEVMKVAGEEIPLYTIACDRSMTLRVPIKRAEEVGLRPLSNRRTVERAFATLRDAPRPQMGLWARRSRVIDEKVNSGDLVIISQVLRDLTPRNLSERGLSYSERQYYDQALERVSREISLVKGQDQDAVRASIHKALSEQSPPMTAS